MFFLEVLDASHEFNHIPKASCEWFLFMLKHICAKKWMPKVAPVSWISYPHPVTLSKPPSHPLMDWPSREGKSRSGAHQWKSHETPVQRWNQRGRRTEGDEWQRWRRGGDGGGGNGLQKQQRQENKQQGEKNKWEKRERRRRSSEAPKVLELIKMICIYLWGLMSSFSMVCFPLIWIFPFHYVT